MSGGIVDDLMVTRSASPDDDGTLMLVVNASRKEVDYAHIAARLPDDVRLQPAPERALLALQGPAAEAVMAKLSDVAARPRLHGGRQRQGRRVRLPRLALGLHRRGRLRDLGCGRPRRRSWRACCWRKRACSRSASARATRCGSRPGFASTATTSTRPRARSRPGSNGRSRSGAGRKAAFPGAARIQDELAKRPQAPPRRHQARRPRAGARGHRDPGAAGRSLGHRHLGRLRADASTGRSPWATCRPGAPSPARR